MRGTFLAVVLLLAACQPTATAPGPSPTQSAAASPIHITPPAADLLFAVVENAVRSGCCGGEPSGISVDTVAIVGLDGHPRATATFLPRKLPPIGNAAVILQAPALVAGSGVYYLDGNGTVRVLHVTSEPQVVANFSQKPQPFETWFAVSPDGSHIVAGVLTFDSVGSYFSLYTARAGGTPTPTITASGVGPPSQMQFVPFPIGWSSAGLVAMDPESIVSQNAWFGGKLEVLTFGPSGVQTASTLGGQDCRSASFTPRGLIPCISSKGIVTVRDATGKLIWTTHVKGLNAVSLYLSPDGQAISDGQQQSSDGGATWFMVAETHARGAIQMPNGFRIEGWLDSNTVIGAVTPPGGGGEGNLSWVSLDDPGTLHDLGFKGDFVATLA